MAAGSPQAEVLIPTWNRVDLLREVLDSLRGQTVPAKVCVVDNGSTDGSADAVRNEFPEVRLVALDRNVGFGRALNLGVQGGESELLILLNNDAVADERFVELADPDPGRVRGRDGCWLPAPSRRLGRLVRDRDRPHHGGLRRRLGRALRDRGPCEAGAAGPLGRRRPVHPQGVRAGRGVRRADVCLLRGRRPRNSHAAARVTDCEVAYDAFALHRGSDTLGSGSRERIRTLAAFARLHALEVGKNLPPPVEPSRRATDPSSTPARRSSTATPVLWPGD